MIHGLAIRLATYCATCPGRGGGVLYYNEGSSLIWVQFRLPKYIHVSRREMTKVVTSEEKVSNLFRAMIVIEGSCFMTPPHL